MATDLDRFTISFPDGYDGRLEFETPSKGYLRDVMVHLDDGSSYKLFFIDPIRLQQDLQADVANGREHYAQPGMVVLPEVTTESIQKAVAGLLRESFFEQLKPLPKPASDKLRG
jgi:hypothetical protein